MYILPQPIDEPAWLAGSEQPRLAVNEVHLWRAVLEFPGHGRFDAIDAISRAGAERLWTALFRNDVMRRYTVDQIPGVLAGPASGLRMAVAECDGLALMAVSRNVREVGLDLERVRSDIPVDEMADGFLDAHSRWDLRITRCEKEKAWKFFKFWTSNEACAQTEPSQGCCVRTFSPDEGFLAALAMGGGPEAQVRYWDWQR